MNKAQTFLDLGRKNLKSLPDSILNLSELQTLYLSDNQLTTLPESIGNLSELLEFYLVNNELTTLPESIGNLSELVEFYLGDNQLTTLPESIGNLVALRALYLNSNTLSTLPESIGNLSALVDLNLSHNQLTTLPESIGNLSELSKLRLNNNELTTLPESIGNLSELRELNLNHNELTTLPESIGNLSELTFLKLMSNQLTTLPESIGKLTKLKKLWTFDNKLRLPKKLMNSLLNLGELQIINFEENEHREEENEDKEENEDQEENEDKEEYSKKIVLHNHKSKINNAFNITPNMLMINRTIIPSANLPNRNPKGTIVLSFDNIYSSDIIDELSVSTKAILLTYSYRGDYFVNRFLSTDIFSTVNNSNTYTVDILLQNDKHLRNISIYKKIATIIPLSQNRLSKSEIIQYKQKLIYCYFILLYNSIIQVCRVLKEKIPNNSRIIIYRGSRTHYLKTDSKKFYYFNSFTSTTTDLAVTKAFSDDGPIYQFIVHPACYFCYMGKSSLSKFPREKEVLLTPYHRYLYLKSEEDTHIYIVMPSDLEIPNTFEEFLPWKNTVVNLSKNIPQTGGKVAIIQNTRKNIKGYTRNTRKNIKTKQNTQNKKLKYNWSRKNNTKKNMQPLMNTRQNTRQNTKQNTKQNDAEEWINDRSRRWTDPISSFPGKAPTESEWQYINMVKASLGK